jgi:hypothetical protein
MFECQFIVADPSSETLENKELRFMAHSVPRQGDSVTFPSIDELKGRIYTVETVLHGFTTLESGDPLHLITVHLTRLLIPLRNVTAVSR